MLNTIRLVPRPTRQLESNRAPRAEVGGPPVAAPGHCGFDQLGLFGCAVIWRAATRGVKNEKTDNEEFGGGGRPDL